ncbi:hypothetical protein EV360DRAFT_84400 [Lentinula raphanica]|nr:hypothetical protein EV360DRAFT_84400 [Lentinula raphanica]
MSSTTNSAAHTMDPNIPVSETVELMHDMRDILLECHKQHHETNAPSKLREAKRGVRGAADEQAANSSMKCSLPKRKFGFKSQHLQRTNPLAANYDCRFKYPENRQYHEHNPEARVWWVYLDEATAFDNNMIGELGDSLDILLVFTQAGLFSAVVTGTPRERTFIRQFRDVDLMDRSNKISSSDPIPEPWDIDFALAFCASDAPVNLSFIEAPRLLKPSEGLSWLVAQ